MNLLYLQHILTENIKNKPNCINTKISKPSESTTYGVVQE